MSINQTSLLIYIRLGGGGRDGEGDWGLLGESRSRGYGEGPPAPVVPGVSDPRPPLWPLYISRDPDTGPPPGRAVAGNRAWRQIQRFTELPDAYPRPSSPGPSTRSHTYCPPHSSHLRAPTAPCLPFWKTPHLPPTCTGLAPGPWSSPVVSRCSGLREAIASPSQGAGSWAGSGGEQGPGAVQAKARTSARYLIAAQRDNWPQGCAMEGC